VALDGDRGRGSARSISGFHLYEALSACSEHLDRFGGHRQAAGMDIARGALPAFREAFEGESARRLEGVDLRPTLRVDLEITPAQATLSLVDRLRHLGPHGMGNPKPVFVGRGLALAEPPRVVGNGHVRLRFKQDGHVLEGIGFRMAERVASLSLGRGPIDAVFQLQENAYRGEVRVQARLMDVRPARDGL
jgi:single-stranded-DNA-specific exonuclease